MGLLSLRSSSDSHLRRTQSETPAWSRMRERAGGRVGLSEVPSDSWGAGWRTLPLLFANRALSAVSVELAPVTFLGLDGLRDVWRRWHTRWASFRLEIEDAFDGVDRVVVVDRGYGRREPDGPEEMLRRAGIWTVRDGRVLHLDANVPVAEALAAVTPTT
jgi:hypothetical protein